MVQAQKYTFPIFQDAVCEASVVLAFINRHDLQSKSLGDVIDKVIQSADADLVQHLSSGGYVESLFGLCEFFEGLIGDSDRRENGVVFTPQYIVDYILGTTVSMENFKEVSVMDPSCGCGSFLLRAAEYIFSHSDFNIEQVISKMIFGIDINGDNVRRCKILLSLLVLLYGGDPDGCTFNLSIADSLESNWSELFGIDKFDYIVGNPPYVNTHDMSAETIRRLKDNFISTQKGTFNIFYAFIEQSMKYVSLRGGVCYIIPNNYMTISAAATLRTFLTKNKYISRIIDFDHNMVFAPVRTYNSILYLSKTPCTEVAFTVLHKCSDIATALSSAKFDLIQVKDLDPNGWNLLSDRERENIKLIRSAGIPLKSRIRVGIATLKDNVYLLDGYDGNKNMYYKMVENKKYYIEAGATRALYKVSDIKAASSLEEMCRRIIFPYTYGSEQVSMLESRSACSYSAIAEDELRRRFPQCYEYLCQQRIYLDSRDKGKAPISPWYGYGRTQGLNLHGHKLLFPTFSNRPKFVLGTSDDALFCNGYAVIDLNDEFSLELLARILNSTVMQYYIMNTSYAIEGNYRCYQKKYVQDFSLPQFSPAEKEYLLSYDVYSPEIDEFLIKKYRIIL